MGSEALEKCYNVQHGLLAVRVVVGWTTTLRETYDRKPYQVANFGEGIAWYNDSPSQKSESAPIFSSACWRMTSNGRGVRPWLRLLFDDEELEQHRANAGSRRPGQPSPAAHSKKAARLTADGLP